jgi:transcriptional regulator with XRE-family HTH domain
MQPQEQQSTSAHQYRRRLTVAADPAGKVMEQLREIAEQKYHRRFKVLADRLGWDATKLSKLFKGTHQPTLGDAFALAAALCVPLSEVLHQLNL